MREIERILDETRRAFDGDPWHGSSTMAILRDVGPEQAVSHPIAGAHSIFEIVLHLTVWTREVTRRILGSGPAVPPEGDWPAVPAEGSAAWKGALESLKIARRELLAALARFDEGRLDTIVGEGRDAPEGSGVPFAVMLHGLSQHDAYHSGQIGLLKKALSPS
jgi:uncharacterized damage-inducible protein DinB